jgi:hypothetical protein
MGGSLLENVIFGDQLTSLLRVVPVSGKEGDVIEQIYDTPMMSRVTAKEINEIVIEVRNMEGRPIKFDYGIVIVTLIFKRTISF